MKFLLSTLLLLNCNSSFANTVILDFQSLEHMDAIPTQHDSIYTEDGYTLNSNNTVSRFATWGTRQPPNLYLRSTALINLDFNGLTTLTKSDNGLFNLMSIDLAASDPGNQILIGVSFTGTKADNSTVTQTFTGITGFDRYFLNNFTNLNKVEWTQSTYSIDDPFDGNYHTGHQFDNIVLNFGGDIVTTPVPAAAWLFSSALMGFVGLRRKQIV